MCVLRPVDMFKSAAGFESDLLKVQSINRKLGGGMTHKPVFQQGTKILKHIQHVVDGLCEKTNVYVSYCVSKITSTIVFYCPSKSRTSLS